MISNKYLLLFIFIVLLLIFGGYYLSKNLNDSLTSTESPNKKPSQPTQPPNQPETNQQSTTVQIYFLWIMIGIWLLEIFSIIYKKKNA